MITSLFLAAALQVPARPPAVMGTRPNLSFAFVTGWIDRDFSRRLEHLLASNPQVKYIQIESLGGHLSEAYKAAELANRRAVEIRVLGRCASACAVFWAAAESRSLVEGARIGLHAGTFAKEPLPFLRDVAERHHVRRQTKVLEQAGFPPGLIAKGLATPNHSILWISSPELTSAGVRFRLVPARWPKVQRQVSGRLSSPHPAGGLQPARAQTP